MKRHAPAGGLGALRRHLAEAGRAVGALLRRARRSGRDPDDASAVMLHEAQEELRRVNRELERSEERFRTIVESVTDIVAIIEADRTIRYASPSVHAVLGYRPDERIGRQPTEPVHPADAERVERFYREVFAKPGTSAQIVFRARHKDGSWRYLEAVGVNLLKDPAIQGVLVSSRDITPRVEAEGRYRSLFEHMVEGVAHCRMLYDDAAAGPRDWIYLTVNRAFARVTGLRDVVGKRASEAIPGIWEENPEVFDICHRVATTGEPARFEHYFPGIERWFAISAYCPAPGEVVMVSDNITERKRTEEKLRRSEAEYRGLVEQAPLGIYRSTRDGRFLAVNPALVAMLGYSTPQEALTLSLPRDVYADPEVWRRLTAEALAAGTTVAETDWKRRDGRVITVRLRKGATRTADGDVDYFEAVVEDVSEQRRLEQQFRQAQKMEAVGRLAGGVAHDFNNLLTAITGYSDLLLLELATEDPKRGEVSEIRAAAQRAAGLTRQLLAFSRRQVLQSVVLDLNDVVRGVERMLRRLIGEHIRLDVVLRERPVMVRADAGQLEQVIVNLVVNARDAMPDGGRVTIETAVVELDEAHAREYRHVVKPGRYVMLAVRDTGTGMDADVMSHLFEPFFTTKEAGKGTGLGLATVYGIVKQSGGSIWPYSDVGRGTTFKIYLPPADEPAATAEPAPAAEAAASRGETLLLVEDDAGVRAVATRVLAARGYTLLRAADGHAALELARSHEGPIDLLLTDLVMPGMPGSELAAVLRDERPEMRVLFMSGYSDDAVVRQGVLEPGTAYLAKPFNAEQLAHEVREVLDAPREGATQEGGETRKPHKR